MQSLEGQQKIYSNPNQKAATPVYSLNTVNGDDECNLETKNNGGTPKQRTNTTPGAFRKQPFRSSSKLRQPFKSPIQTRQQTTSLEDEASLVKEIETLKAKLEILDNEIKDLSEEYSEKELQQQIQMLHEYNEIKDVGQLLLGKLAEIDGTTTRAMYQEFGLDTDD
ncbi:DNA repair protein SWI5 homolog [Stylophora pistillata]|uniref:DNA repair protein SWI5 homolog n=1 Tax=Stylophora pistillata TaxID=50429 RepID=A0A2B4S9A5_STYPI|nr:DNA repair protein SWI5 homolog [Stylophora pistillata]PFX25679.1 DNA repair protein SWI5-like [Stylophora pistillata]